MAVAVLQAAPLFGSDAPPRRAWKWENVNMGIDDLLPESATPSLAVRELVDGLAFWDSRRDWGKDLGNADYAAWVEVSPSPEY